MKPVNLNEEREFLDSLVVDYKDQSPYSSAKKDIIHNLIIEKISNPSSKRVLQLGCSGGYETSFLAETFGHVDVIDGSSKFIESMKSKNNNNNVRFVYSLFEDYPFEKEKYDYIFCNYILEHVYDPVEVLKRVKVSLKTAGKMFATVPNSNAFSRQLAQKMGIVSVLADLTPNDLAHGHRRTYNQKSIVRDFENAGFEIIETQGVVFKILADFQLNKALQHEIITNKFIAALQEMSGQYKNLCDSILVVAKK